jgi:hypothetical protein
MKNIILILAIIFTVNASGQIKVTKLVNNSPIFGYIDYAHTDEINQTRKLAGADILVRQSRLDSLALKRCLRYAKFMLDDSRYITDTVFGKKEIHHDYAGLFKSENATFKATGAGFAENKLKDLTETQVQIKVIESKYIPEYNDSRGHYENRIRRDWKKFGSAIVVIFVKIKNPNYDPNGISLEYIPQAIFLNYEVFE